jgi:hypothetical protein
VLILFIRRIRGAQPTKATPNPGTPNPVTEGAR